MPKTVLLAEDDEDLRLALMDVLEIEGYDLVVSGNGLHALQSCAGKRLHAAVLDLNLPGLAGAEVARTLRERDPSTRVLLMTGAEEVSVPQGVELLPKPFAVERLLARLRCEA